MSFYSKIDYFLSGLKRLLEEPKPDFWLDLEFEDLLEEIDDDLLEEPPDPDLFEDLDDLLCPVSVFDFT